jgi:hypothetical protein
VLYVDAGGALRSDERDIPTGGSTGSPIHPSVDDPLEPDVH